MATTAKPKATPAPGDSTGESANATARADAGEASQIKHREQSAATKQTDKTADSQSITFKGGQQALKQVLGPVAWRLNVGRFLAFIAAVLAVAPYVALVELGKIWLEGGDWSRAKTVVMWLVTAFCLRLCVYFAALAVTHFADLKLGYLLRQDLMKRLAGAPLGWFSETNSGRVRKGLHDDIAQIHQLVAHAPVEMTTAVVQPLLTLIYAFIVDWRLGLLTIATLPLYAAIMSYEMHGMGDKTMEMDQKLGDVSATMMDFARGITVVKAFGKVGQAHRNYADAAKTFSTFYSAWCLPLLKVSALGEAVVAVPLLLAINLGGGAAMVAAGWVNPAQVLATTLIALLLPNTITVFATLSWSYQVAGGAAYRIVDLLHTENLPEPPDDHHVTVTSTDIDFDHVTFSYLGPDDPNPAVKDLTLHLAQGTVTALIGPSGSGKSTAASLVARFFDPISGAVTIGGINVKDFTAHQLYRTVAFVLQNPKLVRASIHDNIALGRPDATREQVIAAAKAANIHADIEGLDHGYDTVYGDQTSLSGGQRQRIAIARALLIDAPILILDEATAYADPENEALIQQALSRLARGRTVLVIGHRPESIRGADQIVVLERGQVQAVGTHEELLANQYYVTLMEETASRRYSGDLAPTGDGVTAATTAESVK